MKIIHDLHLNIPYSREVHPSSRFCETSHETYYETLHDFSRKMENVNILGILQHNVESRRRAIPKK